MNDMTDCGLILGLIFIILIILSPLVSLLDADMDSFNFIAGQPIVLHILLSILQRFNP